MQNKPTKFLEYLQSNFNDQENFEKLLDFISTIPNQKPEEFIPLAQTILISNKMPIFDNNIEALSARLNIINFTVEHHPNDSKTNKNN